MRILIVSGIYPPDIGGPATHAADLRAELTDRGHHVDVLTYADDAHPTTATGVTTFPRSWAWPVRTAAVLGWLYRNARHYDVVYSTGLATVAVAGARLSHRPVVLKIVGDPAWERASRRGLTDQTFESFQDAEAAGAAVRTMRGLRNFAVRHATRVVAPSEHLAAAVARWSGRTDVVVVPNGVRSEAVATGDRPDRAELHLLFVGRLVEVKGVEHLIGAVAAVPSATLEIVGDGPEDARLRTLAARLGVDDRVRFAGALAHDAVMARIADADALVLASSHEGLPHVVLEALVVGTPVVASRAGGVGEILSDGTDSLLVDHPSPEALAAAFERLAHDSDLRRRLRTGAASTGRNWRFDRCADQVEALLHSAVAHQPSAVFVGKSRMAVPPPPELERKYEIHRRHLRSVVVCTAERPGFFRPGGATVIGLPSIRVPVLGTAAFYSVGPALALLSAAGRSEAAVVCQSPYEGAVVIALRTVLPRRWRPPVQIELHGDWRTATRLYGSPLRAKVARASDATAEWALRRADRVRPVSETLAQLARDRAYRGPLDRFVAFSDYGEFLRDPPQPVPAQPAALFAGVLERYKAVDVLLEAWVAVVRAVPDATLTIVGTGKEAATLSARIEELDLAGSVTMRPPVPRPVLRRMLDDVSCLVLPSRSEGLPRIVLEAMARGRAIVATRVGGIDELVDDGRNGRLVDADDAAGLTEALIDVLGDAAQAQRMGDESRRRAAARNPLDEYETGIKRLACWIETS